MDKYNFKVVAELRSDLTENQRLAVSSKIGELQQRLKIVNIDNETYCKEPPIKDYDDFGAVNFFFSALKDMKEYFKKLEYYDLREDDKHIEMLELKILKIDFELPDFLENDIKEYVKAFNSDSLSWDCWWGEVYGSINMAQSGNIITDEQADMLRNHYLFKKRG